jgi:1,4-dihydroxy-6-naphthoate synthase
MKERKGIIKLAISPCPNDTFIFGAWINELIHSEIAIEKVEYLDIQELNKQADHNQFDLIKVSAAKAFQLQDRYNILPCGGALGINCGPLLISKKPISPANIDQCIIAIPGQNTTAHFLFQYAFPKAINKKFIIFSNIEDALIKDEFDAGVIIHESRFTYQNKGLRLIEDLGLHWNKNLNLPIPLGLILIKKDIDLQIQHEVIRTIRSSINFANSEPDSLQNYIQSHAQEMELEVIQQHIQLYVNKYSYDLGIDGNQAIKKLFEIISQKKS